ncbi:TetR family transcriptional regulator, partial [Streptomyces sp. SID7803]|nr:TetR family transcriptional regulator [Streptomyces sp. SID7803]
MTPERAQELYTAVLDTLRESGYESLTMEGGVAARSRCGKSTLYRQW